MASASNGYASVVNSTGDLTLSPTRSNQSFELVVSGVARRTHISIDKTGRKAGDRVLVDAELPAVEGIELDFRDATASGSALLPDDQFTDNLYVTDGETLSASFEFVLTAHRRWKYLRKSIPA